MVPSGSAGGAARGPYCRRFTGKIFAGQIDPPSAAQVVGIRRVHPRHGILTQASMRSRAPGGERLSTQGSDLGWHWPVLGECEDVGARRVSRWPAADASGVSCRRSLWGGTVPVLARQSGHARGGSS